VNEIILGDCLEVMKTFPDNHFTGIVTDPPYGLGFMGKKWDHDVPGIMFWKETLRISKAGSHSLVFGGTRKFHRMAVNLEDAGWEIRDCLMWLFGSGFPKSHNHFGIEGFGTALKPAYEPIILAMKPLDGTFKQNVERWGQAGINIAASRTGNEIIESFPTKRGSNIHYAQDKWTKNNVIGKYKKNVGRWPANVIFDEEAAELLGPPSRFFYCAKASSRERNEGLEGFKDKPALDNPSGAMGSNMGSRSQPRENNHPTVKPLALMRYLITLIAPPQNALILDPFAGSGSTIIAAEELGIRAIGIEKHEEYVEIARARVKYTAQKVQKIVEQMDFFP
jgi:DNA modification methylase